MITSFRKEYSFLSNFFEDPVTVFGLTFRNGEAAFHSQKNLYESHRFCDLSGSDAKKLGRKVYIADIHYWDSKKLEIMYEVLKAKFAPGSKLAIALLRTGDNILMEGNVWHDNYWGVCSCDRCHGKGKNNLGRLLMVVRSELKNNS